MPAKVKRGRTGAFVPGSAASMSELDSAAVSPLESAVSSPVVAAAAGYPSLAPPPPMRAPVTAADVATTIGALVRHVSTANRHVVAYAVASAEQSHALLAEHSLQATALNATVADSICRLGETSIELQTVTLARDALQDQLSVAKAQLQRGAAQAVRYVTDAVGVRQHVAVAAQRALSTADAQSTTLAAAMGQHRAYVAQSLTALQAPLATVHSLAGTVAMKDVQLQRLQTSLRWSDAAAERHHQELLRLMQIVQLLGAKTKVADVTGAQVLRLRRLVAGLENQLALEGIVAAVVPEGHPVRARAALAAAASSNAKRPAAPSDSLKRVSPELFALRLLLHKDVGIAELVDAWAAQDDRIATLEADAVQLREALAKLQRSADSVCLQFAREKSRREGVEARLSEMSRERVSASGQQAALDELNRVRYDVSLALDRNALLEVDLEAARAEVVALRHRDAVLSVRIGHLEAEGAADHVAQAMAALRLHYSEELRRMHGEHSRVAAEAAATAVQLDTANAALAALQAGRPQLLQTIDRLTRTVAKVEADLAASTAEKRRLVEQLAAASAARVAEIGKRNISSGGRSAFAARADGLVEDVRSGSSNGAAAGSALSVATLAALAHLRQACREAAAPQPAVDLSVTLAAASAPSSSAPSEELAGVLHTMLSFLTAQTEASQALRTTLLDDALALNGMRQELQGRIASLTTERDGLKAQIAALHDIVEQNSLKLTENVIGHEVVSAEGAAADDQAIQDELRMLRSKTMQLQLAVDAAAAGAKGSRAAMVDVQQQMALAAAGAAASSAAAKQWRDALDGATAQVVRLSADNDRLSAQLTAQLEAQAEGGKSSGSGDASSAALLAKEDEMLAAVGELLDALRRQTTARPVAAADADAEAADTAGVDGEPSATTGGLPSAAGGSDGFSRGALSERLASEGVSRVAGILGELYQKAAVLRTQRSAAQAVMEPTAAAASLAAANDEKEKLQAVIAAQSQELSDVKAQLEGAKQNNAKQMKLLALLQQRLQPAAPAPPPPATQPSPGPGVPLGGAAAAPAPAPSAFVPKPHIAPFYPAAASAAPPPPVTAYPTQPAVPPRGPFS